VLKKVIFLLQVDFTDDFVPDYPFKLCFCQFKLWHRLSPLLYQVLKCILGCWKGNLMRIPKMCVKQSFSHSKWVLSLTVLSNCVSVSSNFDTAFLSYCTKFWSVFSGYWINNLIRILKMCLKQSFSHSSGFYRWFCLWLSNCAQTLQKSEFRKDFLLYLIQNVFLESIKVILTVVTWLLS